MKKLENEDLLETLEKRSSKEWNEAIASRLEPLRAYLDSDEWKKGISPFLRSVQGHTILRILNEKAELEQIHFLRGFAAGLQLAISLPGSIEAQIQQESTKGSNVPKGAAGY